MDGFVETMPWQIYVYWKGLEEHVFGLCPEFCLGCLQGPFTVVYADMVGSCSDLSQEISVGR